MVVQGANLTPAAKLIVPFKADFKPLVAAKPMPNQARFQITVDPATPIGIYPLRLSMKAAFQLWRGSPSIHFPM